MNFEKYLSLQHDLKRDSVHFFKSLKTSFCRKHAGAVSNNVIIVIFFCKFYCSLKWKIKEYQR